jgi:N-acyl-D-aspartate/D-glutamate deacylase
VTTDVVGQCGFSAAPLGEPPDPSQMLGYREAGAALDWRSFGGDLDRLQAAGPAVSVAALVGHGALVRAAGDGASQAMEALAEAAIEEGAWGLSTGLENWPGSAAAEIERLAAVAGQRARLGLIDRGVLRCWALADVVVFDAGAVDDQATAQGPQVHPSGFAQVVVNGVFVVRDGQRNDERPGRVLRCGA